MSPFSGNIRRSISLRDHYDSVKGLVFGMLAAALSALHLMVSKLIMVSWPITVPEIMYQRSWIALVMLLGIMQFNKISVFNVRENVLKFVVIRSVGNYLGFVFTIMSIYFIPISDTIILINNPFVTGILSLLILKEKMSKHDVIAFSLATLGIITLTAP